MATATTNTPGSDATLKDRLTGGAGPLADKAKAFAKARPFATATLAGVLGVALLNTLRGK
jgi:hypothetical protein